MIMESLATFTTKPGESGDHIQCDIESVFLKRPHIKKRDTGNEFGDDSSVLLIPRNSPPPKKKEKGCKRPENPDTFQKVFFLSLCVHYKLGRLFPEIKSGLREMLRFFGKSLMYLWKHCDN